jgi:undecaprenyl-diphosphatase
MIAVTLCSVPLFVLLPVLYIAAGDRRRGYALSIVLLVALVTTVGCQYLFDRPRPTDVRLVLPPPRFPSFPSGHAALTLGMALFITLTGDRRASLAWAGAGLALLSRLYLGHHYPSDVLAGAVLGLAAGASGYGLLYRTGKENRPRWAWLLWEQVALVLIVSLGAYLGLLDVPVLAIRGLDKAAHFALYGVLSFFLVGWLASARPYLVLSVLVAAVTVEEFAQSLCQTRSFDPLDLIATTAGVLSWGWIACRLVHIKRHTEQPVDARRRCE